MRAKILLFVLSTLLLRVGLYLADHPAIPVGATVRIAGRITGMPGVRGKTTEAKIDSYRIRLEGPARVFAGQRIEVVGRVTEARRGGETIISVNADNLRLIADNTAVIFKTKIGILLYNLRQSLKVKLLRLLPAEEAALAAGIVLGEKESVGFDFYNNLRKTGTIHMLVASGSNLAMLSAFIVGSFSWIGGRRRAMLAAIILMWAYAGMVGMEAPVVRAAIMGSVAIGGELFGRQAHSLRLLFLCGGLMVFIRPAWVWDVGFQLSFSATLGLISVPGLVGVAGKLVKRSVLLKIPKALFETISAQVFSLPVLVLNFGWSAVSVIAPVANLAVGWLVAPIMVMGSGLILLDGFFGKSWLVYLWAGLVYVPLHAFVEVVSFLGGMGG